MVLRAFGTGVLVAAGGYWSLRTLVQERTGDSMLRLGEMRNRLNPPLRQKTKKVVVPAYAVEHEYYTAVRERWNSGVLAFRKNVIDFFDEMDKATKPREVEATTSITTTVREDGDSWTVEK
ncbi:hypothetical protein H257_05338 [Aphanomyces astaci]|uniref:Uncharacterized protein n=1 Tax=Aphanomyces astaci TaxID=112090 RepID=W4GQX8_APHAT|nr:hypothetical protein H257_05338 [Aphanomyces astaci]ETV81746.1 hypothetical protein H257_05338 [Aphanomyces astaci]KAF0754983.1 hypothetical protein AaE_005121 [Aphanomyces astaci]RHX99068.1 hypothetical protein DYB25_001460 [Aphanomyces astaci]RHY07079.1 hypothetical protein DYB36_005120 [Aphanomyces astaci]RHY40995.1 hypothetical protein DYB38_002279 [Aphanomyces astaci]|eukprot:XP_009828483.1 hypothetical protein H257_05338 [Aphanomyces astaci]